MKAIVMLVMLAILNVQPAQVVETYDDIMVVETMNGNIYEYEFDGMTEKEANAEYVVISNIGVTIVK